ncbi:hypothetical protein [uncultured Enterovirga sp.]|uniref:hypothetical protein n=1 Tax=uncultured Enterovirga sp. TaxID=2026352 RepID=UPI0035CB8E34
MWTRRGLLEGAAVGVATGVCLEAVAAPASRRLIDGVTAACRRLGPQGWRGYLLTATGGELDILARDLRAELAKPLTRIDRSLPGLAEFTPDGRRGVEPGQPAASLLYHALASSEVVADATGRPLGGFPTMSEIEAVENYVYGAEPPSLDAIRRRAGDHPLAIAVFSLEYRRAAESAQGRHADLCFSRTGIARMGTFEPRYDAKARAFEPLDPARPFGFRTIPQRFAAYLAVRLSGDEATYLPRDFLKGDDELGFWVPLHKLFDGRECLAGLDLRVQLTRSLQNEKLRRFHRYLEIEGFPSSWGGEDLNRFPFIIRDEAIANFSRRPDMAAGVIEPKPSPLAIRARYQDTWLTFEVPPDFVRRPGVMYFSTAQLLPGGAETAPSYMHGLGPTTDRPAPEYISIRHRVRPDGTLENLSAHPELMEIIAKGGYRAQHFIDYAGDGAVMATVPQLAGEVKTRLPAYCMIAPPDFFPYVSQRDLSIWWQTEVPTRLRGALWAVPPTSLAERRLAGNVNLGLGFSINDTTITALVSHPTARAEPALRTTSDAPALPELATKAARTNRYSGLPDASPGIFDPGWDTSLGQRYGDPDTLQPYMQNFGLGTPFVEDVKLCAALGSYWPGVAPDSSRTFSPLRRGPGFDYPWPTVVPLTDVELGIVPVEGERYLPWDGVRGPRLETAGDGARVRYPDINRVDYLTGLERMTALLLAKIDLPETKARVLATASLYWALGLRDPEPPAGGRAITPEDRQAVIDAIKDKAGWAVLSFRAAEPGDPELAAAEAATSARLAGERRYRFHVFRPGQETRHPSDMASVLVELKEQAVAFVGSGQVLLKRGDGAWQLDASIPTS